MMLVVITCLVLEVACIQAAAVRIIPIPPREHGYNQFDSRVILSQVELDAFLENISTVQAAMWNNRAQFIAAITQARIDFSNENLVLIRHTEGSGSVRLAISEPVVEGHALVFEINRQAPDIRTADMAYYCYALVVGKAVATVEIKIDDRPVTVLPINNSVE